MQSHYLEQVKNLLFILKNSNGHFIVQDDKVYCQFSKNALKDPIRFEALSHHFDESINKDLSSQFQRLGFTLEVGENYAKNIYLNSENDIENAALETMKIFEEIYEVDKQSDYDFDVEIAEVDTSLRDPKSGNATSQSEQGQKGKSSNLSIGAWVAIILGAIFCYYVFFDNDDARSNSNRSDRSKYVINEESFATSNKSDFDEMYTYVIQNDSKALQSMLDKGQITVLQAGTDVYVVDGGLSYSVIRLGGTTQKLWIANERLSSK